MPIDVDHWVIWERESWGQLFEKFRQVFLLLLSPSSRRWSSLWVMFLKYKQYARGFFGIQPSTGIWWTWPLHNLVSAPPQPGLPCSRPFSNILSSFFLHIFPLCLQTCSIPMIMVMHPFGLRNLTSSRGHPHSLAKLLTCLFSPSPSSSRTPMGP